MWNSKPKKITSATLGLEAKIAPTIIYIYITSGTLTPLAHAL